MNRFKSSTAFQDLLFNLLLGFVFLFVVALLLINPITKKSDAPKKAEFLITMEWADDSNNDVDLWVKSPSGLIASFVTKNAGLMHLERDDLGHKNDTINGVTLSTNEETLTLRGVEAGEYEVMFHVYRQVNKDADNTVRAKLIKINPFGIKYEVITHYLYQNQHVSLFRFTLDKDGNVISTSLTPSDFIPSKKYSP